MEKEIAHDVHELVLTVINDGNGEICGASYDERIDHIKKSLRTGCTCATFEVEKWVRTAVEWLRCRGYGEEAPRSRQRKIFKQAANEIFEYYSSN